MLYAESLAKNKDVFFVYVDMTLEDTSRPFYVGKGKMKRVRKRERNAYWQNIASKHGWRREVMYATKDEAHAFELEKRWIAELGTFENGESSRWGSNLTEGGEGPSGAHVNVGDANASKRLEVRQKISETLFRTQPLVNVKKSLVTLEKKSKITWMQAEEIRRRWHNGETQRKLAREYGLAACSVNNIVHGRKWKQTQ